jgi:hypothetical protein
MLLVPKKMSGSTSWSSPETVRFLKWKTVPDRTSPAHWLEQHILQILILISFTTHFFLHQSKRSLFKIEQDGHYRTWPVWDNIIVTELETGSNHFFNKFLCYLQLLGCKVELHDDDDNNNGLVMKHIGTKLNSRPFSIELPNSNPEVLCSIYVAS